MWLSLIVIVLDQITKAMVNNSLELYQRISLFSLLELTHQHNTGAAFSMLNNASGWQRWFFIALGVTVSVALMVWLRRIRGKHQKLLSIGLALILGGALGNVIDRVWLGYVIDFIHVHWDRVGFSFPAFNVADSAITIGAGCLILDAFLEGREPPTVIVADERNPDATRIHHRKRRSSDASGASDVNK
ncbi:MAG: signal peptidase II [Steroidobacter sp.]